jgi:hypothetical protein
MTSNLPGRELARTARYSFRTADRGGWVRVFQRDCLSPEPYKAFVETVLESQATRWYGMPELSRPDSTD